MSYTIDKVKTVKERLTSNYSSGQLLTTLDDLIFRSLEPIIRDTDFVDRSIGYVLNWYGKPTKRKISSLPKEQVMYAMFAFLAESDITRKLEYLRQAQLERSIYFQVLRFFGNAVEGYKEYSIHAASSTLQTRLILTQNKRRIEQKVGARTDLFATVNESQYWSNQANTFKTYITEKYMRHALNKAMGYAKNTKLKVDREDLVQNFMLAISKAIDKCSADKGTLTTYIDHWLRSAQTNSESDHHYNIAYRIPQHMRQGLATHSISSPGNISVKLEGQAQDKMAASPDVLDDVQEEDEGRVIRLLLKRADPWGFARRTLGIEEELTNEEIQILMSEAY